MAGEHERDRGERPIALADEPGLVLRHAHAEPLAAELATMLDRLVTDHHTFLIVDVSGTGRYVQFITDDGTHLRAESVGNIHLFGRHRLTGDDQTELDRLGWMPPELGKGNGGNHWQRWEPPNVHDAAQLAALTLYRVHHAVTAAQLRVTAHRAATWEPDEGAA